jgi:hypothetical protein
MTLWEQRDSRPRANMSFGPQILAGLPETHYMGQITYVLNIEVRTAQIFFKKNKQSRARLQVTSSRLQEHIQITQNASS